MTLSKAGLYHQVIWDTPLQLFRIMTSLNSSTMEGNPEQLICQLVPNFKY
jgi:hypothetical protein